MIEYGKDALRFLAGVVVLMMIYKKLLKPMATKLTGADKKQLALTAAQNAAAGGEAVAGAAGSAAEGEDALVTLSGDPPALTGDDSRMDQTLLAVKQVAKENPRMVANVVSSWATAEK